MNPLCNIVAERVALGEPLGDAAEHAASCPRCRRVSALPTELSVVHHETDPGIGFAARMTAGAQKRIVVRRRRRVAATLAACMAATGLGVVFMTRHHEQPTVAVTEPQLHDANQPATETQQPDHDKPDPSKVDEDVKYLVSLARAGRNSRVTARWHDIEKPLAPYKHLIKGITP